MPIASLPMPPPRPGTNLGGRPDTVTCWLCPGPAYQEQRRRIRNGDCMPPCSLCMMNLPGMGIPPL